MEIRNIFEKNINRPINGVIKVDQKDTDVIEQELDEYVITDELRKHFKAFFKYYCQAYDNPTADMGVWISGFFGSGKSHFLKMLSYLLSDMEVNGKRTSQRFIEKLKDVPELQEEIKKSATGNTDAILFNIDIEGPSDKTKTAVLRVFAKMFYNHLGFYGEDLKTARLEQFVSQQGKWEEFQEVFADVHGDSWKESRDVFGFLEDDIIVVLGRVLGMSEQSARDWFNGTEKAEISIAQLVREIKAYVDTKPDNYRLLFMMDEVGQYIGTDTDMLLNFQSLTEKLGSECGGKVWVIATGQEALDEVVKVRQDEFSRIMARFKTRLSLTSSSVDEVIQRRILAKNDEGKAALSKAYQETQASLDNLFLFKNATANLQGFKTETDFTANYPFVPYQFVLLQKVFYEVRKHGNTGKHLAGGERSMLSSFQEAAIQIQTKDEYALAPFYRFYDTMRGFLDSSINRVIDSCEKAANNDAGLELYDVDVLKCLYLIRYVENDLPGNADNIMILMADSLDMDKVNSRQKINASLERLLKQHYIGRTGDVFKFLTDEEQDIQREIDSTNVDTSKITERIGSLIFGDIYTAKKYRYDVRDFTFIGMVDDLSIGGNQGDILIQFLTSDSDRTESELRLITESKGRAIVVLSQESRYYELLEEAMRIRQYVNINAGKVKSAAAVGIIAIQEANAGRLEERVMEELATAIEQGIYYVDGEKISLRAGDAKNKINQAFEYLVTHVYRNYDLITHHVENNEEIADILKGNSQLALYTGKEENATAAKKIEDFLELRLQQKQRTTMGDIQKRYQDIPYGWREIDIAACMAVLIFNQKVTVKYGGDTVRASDPNIIDYLRKRTEIGKTLVQKHKMMSAQKIDAAVSFLEEYLQIMDIPKDENGLVEFILTKFKIQKQHYKELLIRYGGYHAVKYPGKMVLGKATEFIDRVLAKQIDNITLVDELLAVRDDFEEIMDSLDDVESFFESQVSLFDEAFYFEQNMTRDMDYLEETPEAIASLNKIRAILQVSDTQEYDYGRIHELTGLIADVRKAHEALLENYRQKNYEVINQCMNSIHAAGKNTAYVKEQIELANGYYLSQRKKIAANKSILELQGVAQGLFDYQDKAVRSIKSTIDSHERKLKEKAEPTKPEKKPATPIKPPKAKTLYRQTIFPAVTLHSSAEIESYLNKVAKELEAQLSAVDEIKIR
ncbi:BREX system P-loop protein BrxC [Selenomonas caprae]|uniref:BREX system P-loop protein BrxC n=1 Tax=Selenomonas caprae TaxID=2606905 RepID=A0A5D6WIY0_9FIRM|nr:BREX system P-loop protein BrxC [Selenomonas caprae]TYZ28541.1 BREX system P-loop protein BrxC [Selenomonas caprae]